MNDAVRTYLIEAARQNGKFVYYSDVVKDCDLAIDLSTELGRQQLSAILEEVSTFENNQAPPRPLLSSLAIYKNKNQNDHGDGFYRVAEKLGKGAFNKLKYDLYGFVEADRCRKFWQDNSHYTQFASPTRTEKLEEPEFFTQQELDFFKLWQQKPYDPDDEEHVNAKNFLMETVWAKSIYLGGKIVEKLSDFQLDAKKIWHQRGWKVNENGENVQAAIFKPYTWVKIFRNTDRGKDIFFTFGIEAYPEAQAFIYKIDCQNKRDSRLSQAQIDLCKSLIPDTAAWNEIPFDELLSENWHSLTSICVNLINNHLTTYDAIISAVWGEPIPSTLFQNKLIRREKPQGGFASYPETNSAFEGVDIDYQNRADEQKDLGDAGEELVRQHEINFLRCQKRHDKAALVEIVKDGKGYDVYSFDEFGNEKFIEVKTTPRGEYAPFYLSENEIAFMRLNGGKYCIYRVYNFDLINNFGEFFELKGDVENQLLMKATQFQVLIKKSGSTKA